MADHLTANPPPAGDDGREVQLQTTATHVQWRYSGDAVWLDLIPLALITGQDGDDGRDGDDGSDGLSAELQTTATHVQWRQAGGAWADLIPLASLVGPAGPPNTLTIGTVTTLPAGSPATLSLTGEAPEQVLSADIPMGLTGAASDWLKVGPGDPRTPSTTAGQITGTEPNGCSYRSTDGGGVGGYLWTKRAGVWVCVEGDTGSITSKPIAIGGRTPFNSFIGRIGNMVWWYVYYNASMATPVSEEFLDWLPQGFRPPRIVVTTLHGASPVSIPVASKHQIRPSGVVVTNATYSGGSLVEGEMRWRTTNPWPTTLTL